MDQFLDPAKLKTKEDWIRAGELIFDQPIVCSTSTGPEATRNRATTEFQPDQVGLGFAIVMGKLSE